MFTVANAVLVALVQVGVIVLSILGAGLTSRIFKDFPLPAVTQFLVHYGFILMAFPLLWITTATWIRIRKDVGEDAKTASILLRNRSGCDATFFWWVRHSQTVAEHGFGIERDNH